MKLVALDVGEKRIGVATADSAVKIAVPHSTVVVDGGELVAIANIMHDTDAKHLVVGLPRNAAGAETAQSQKVRELVRSFVDYCDRQNIERPMVRFQDESLTSVMAEEHLAMKRRKRRQKGDVDREAATLIMQDFLDGFGTEKTADDSKKKPKSQSKMRRRLLMTLATVAGLLIVVVVGGVTWYAEMTKPVANEVICMEKAAMLEPNAEKCLTIDFEVLEGDSTNDIIDRMENMQLIRSALATKIYLRLNKPGMVIRAGVYSLNNWMKIPEILEAISKGVAAETFRLTFLPGGTVFDAKQCLLGETEMCEGAKERFTAEEIDKALAAKYDHPLLADNPENGSLEGYIFGETYEFYATATLDDVFKTMFDLMYQVIQENDLVEKYGARGLTLYEGINLASIVQREARPVDQSGVAQVFFNRLAASMPLGSDVVIEYRAMQLGLDRRDLSLYEDIDRLGCPWSSRFCLGLPETPVSTPGVSALLAVSDPDASHASDMYFLTGDDQKMYYATNSNKHQENIMNHCQTMCSL